MQRMWEKINFLGALCSMYYQHAVRSLKDEFILRDTDIETPGEDSLVSLVEKARREWEHSKTLFNEAVDPDLLEHAIFAMEAAEKKYIYLLKLARKENISA